MPSQSAGRKARPLAAQGRREDGSRIKRHDQTGRPMEASAGGIGYRDIVQGVPATVVGELTREGLTRADIQMVIPERTLARRQSKGEALTIDEADALARLRRVVGMARRVFGEPGLADEWLRSPNPALGNEVPIRMARTDLGGREVEAVLGRIEHGVFG